MKAILIFLFVGIVLRLTFVFMIHPPDKYLYSDMLGYHERAIKFAAGEKENIYDTFYPPATHIIYSIFTKANHSFFFIKLFNVFISTLTCVFIYFIAKELFGQLSGYIGLAIASFNYLFIDFTGYILSETCFAFMLALMFYCFLKSITASKQSQRWMYSFLAGLSIIIAGAIKSSILLFIPFFGIWWIFNFRKYNMFSNLAFYGAGFLPLLILLVIRFHSITGEYGIISTNGGFNFFQGRSHIKDVYFIDRQRGTVYMFSSPVAVRKNYSYNDTFQTGPYDSKFFYSKGMDEVKTNVPRTLLYSLENLYDLFFLPDVWPSYAIDKPFPFLIKAASILFIIIVLMPSLFMLMVCFRLLLINVRILIVFPILTILITSFVFYGDPRFRVPYDVFFVVIAGYFYAEVYKRLKKWYDLYQSNRLKTANR